MVSSRDIVNLTNPTIGYQQVPRLESTGRWQVHLDHETPRIGVKIKHILIISSYHDPDEYFQNILDLEIFEKKHDNG